MDLPEEGEPFQYVKLKKVPAFVPLVSLEEFPKGPPFFPAEMAD